VRPVRGLRPRAPKTPGAPGGARCAGFARVPLKRPEHGAPRACVGTRTGRHLAVAGAQGHASEARARGVTHHRKSQETTDRMYLKQRNSIMSASSEDEGPWVFNSRVARLRQDFPGATLRDVLDGDDPLDPNGVYVGRGTYNWPKTDSDYYNPYKVAVTGRKSYGVRTYTLQESLRLYRILVMKRIKADPDYLNDLRGKNLYCWCYPQLCHADILLELANAP
jgi:hypothetical protein